MDLRRNADLSTMNSLRLPARAEWLACPETLAQVRALLADDRFTGMPLTVIGEGSNLVLTDDLPGLVIHPRLQGIHEIERSDEHVTVEIMAGETWDAVVAHTLARGWQGLENLSLIPGSAGAAPYQNIGAYGVELSDLLTSVTALHLARGEIQTFTNAECQFAYRDSLFKSQCRGEYLILSLRLRLNLTPNLVLTYGPLQELDSDHISPMEVRERVCAVRREKLPDPRNLPNAGSFFKNPVVNKEQHDKLKKDFPELVAFPVEQGYKLAAGWLIEHAGWKGQRLGPVGMHDRQALVLVNHDGATGVDVMALAERVRGDVRERFGVELEQEPVLLPWSEHQS
jgi:UDP-N-acetylmuramate dehydrogenase